MIFFLDASAIVKRYVEEPGSPRLRALLRARRELAMARISAVEVRAALARRAREGDLRREVAERHAEQFGEDFLAMRIVELRPPVFALASELVWAHPLRAYDAIQLAAALHLKRMAQSALTFVAADALLCDAAAAQSLKVEHLA